MVSQCQLRRSAGRVRSRLAKVPLLGATTAGGPLTLVCDGLGK